ncbi:restriction endonuclease subunit S [Cytophaga hutchinsonii]|nr:restriction endonuclease subunit S [Cytophaga hutchinsonii]
MAKAGKKNTNVPNLRFPEFDEEWEEKTLGEICEMQAGKFVSASEIKEQHFDGLFPCYGGNGLRGYTKSYNYDGKYSLIGRQGALCGNVNFANGKFHATEHAVVVTPLNGINTVWMFYLLTNLNLNQFATGMAQPGLSVQNLEKVESTIPKAIDEQEKIASFLTLIDGRISTQNKIIEELKLLKIVVSQKIFSRQLRLKDDKGKEFSNWEIKKLEEICEKKSSSISANKIENNFGEYLIYGASGILKKVDFYEEENDYVSIVKDGAGVGRLFYCNGRSSVLGTMDIVKPKDTTSAYFYFVY